MKPIRIIIDEVTNGPLNREEIKYTFKTLLDIVGLPCHFMKNKREERIDIYYGKIRSDNCKLFIEMVEIEKENIKFPFKVVTESNYVFFLFDKNQREEEIIHKNDIDVKIWNDIILSSFYLLSGWQERFMTRDQKNRHYIEQSFLYQKKLLHIPIINQYSEILKYIFSAFYDPIPLWPSNKKYAVALSHDVDYPEMIRWIEVLRYIAKYKRQSHLLKIFNILLGKESFWKFKEWVELEKQYGMNSAMYFCGLKGGLLRYLLKAPDPFYDVRQDHFKVVFNYLIQNGFEVGMHSSYLAYQSIDRFRNEKKIIEEVLGEPILGNRHHYWHMNPNNPSETAWMHHQIGLLYDSSICFEKRAGFRFGICSPFNLYDPIGHRPVPTLQLPTALVDNHLFGRFKYCYFSQYQFEIDALLHSVKKYGGIFVVDYHIRSLNQTFFPQWGESYEYILKRINETDDFYCDTPLNIAKYWLKRDEKIHKESVDEDCGVN